MSGSDTSGSSPERRGPSGEPGSLGRLGRRLARATIMLVVGFAGGAAVSLIAGFVFRDVESTLDTVSRWCSPLTEAVNEARWETVPGLRLSEDDVRTIYDHALAGIYEECRTTAGVLPPETLQVVPGDLPYEGLVPSGVSKGERLERYRRRMKRTRVTVGPLQYSFRSVEVSGSYWNADGRLGISLSYECQRQSGRWQCREILRYPVNWPRDAGLGDAVEAIEAPGGS